MAFDASNMHRMNWGTKKVYLYDTADAIATVVAADYFLGFYAELAKGTVIIVVGSTGGTPTVDVLIANAVSSSSVTVVNGT